MAIYLIKDCLSGSTEVINSGATDLSLYIGKVIRAVIGGGSTPACIEIIEETAQDVPEIAVQFQECFSSCEECLTPSYELQDCSGRYGSIYSLDVNLQQHVGKIVRVPYFEDTCFEVISVPYSKSNRYYRRTEISGSYEDCESCKLKIFTDNQYAPLTCDPSKMEQIKCTFSDLIWEKIISRRFAIDFCCPVDAVKYTVKNEITNIDLMNDPTPPLPEPEVHPCCILPPNNCNPTPCRSCNTQTQENQDCDCEIGLDSPHPCHTYSVEVTQEQVNLAIENTNAWYNGKVFFAYFPCGGAKPTIIEIEEDTETSFCVQGIPAFGYFANDEFTYLQTLVREAICEELPINNCCND